MTIPWEHLDESPVPGGGSMTLHRRDKDYMIKVDRYELMGSRMHGSEEILSEEACARIADREKARVLVGGLGMGFTLAAALRSVGPDAEVVVAELVPAIVKWNRELLGHLTGHPLEDKRTTLFEGDVADAIRAEANRYDAILLDVDNSPDALSVEANHWLYGPAALRAIERALRPGGVLGIWSIEPDPVFCRRMEDHGYDVVERWVKARRTKGPRHWIWLAEPGVHERRRPPHARQGAGGKGGGRGREERKDRDRTPHNERSQGAAQEGARRHNPARPMGPRRKK